MRREWDLIAPLIAATGLPLSGGWQAMAEGWVMGEYSSLIFFHISSRGERGGGGDGWWGDAEKRLFQRRRWVRLGLSLDRLEKTKKEGEVSGEASNVSRMRKKSLESLWGLGDVSLCSKEGVCTKW